MNNRIIFYFTLMFLFLVFIWGVHIAILQMDFTDECIRTCLDKNITNCHAIFMSLPISNINGKCIHNEEEIIEIKENSK